MSDLFPPRRTDCEFDDEYEERAKLPRSILLAVGCVVWMAAGALASLVVMLWALTRYLLTR